eukprot:524065-Hanusia_phi.AAC.1
MTCESFQVSTNIGEIAIGRKFVLRIGLALLASPGVQPSQPDRPTRHRASLITYGARAGL